MFSKCYLSVYLWIYLSPLPLSAFPSSSLSSSPLPLLSSLALSLPSCFSLSFLALSLSSLSQSISCSFSLPPSLPLSPYIIFWKTELFSLSWTFLNLNAQLLNSCYITHRVVLRPVPKQLCFAESQLFVDSKLVHLVSRREKTQAVQHTWHAIHLTLWMGNIIHCIFLDNYIITCSSNQPLCV